MKFLTWQFVVMVVLSVLMMEFILAPRLPADFAWWQLGIFIGVVFNLGNWEGRNESR